MSINLIENVNINIVNFNYSQGITYNGNGKLEYYSQNLYPVNICNMLSQILIPSNQIYYTIISYPLTKKIVISLNGNKNGITLYEFLQDYCKKYCDIYDEEKRTAYDFNKIDLFKFKRPRTHGKYGIYNYHLEQLFIRYISVYNFYIEVIVSN